MRKKRLAESCVLLCLLLSLVLAGIAEPMTTPEGIGKHAVLPEERAEAASVPGEKAGEHVQIDELNTAEIERLMESEFAIKEVDFAGMEEEPAREIYRAFSEMTERYPVLVGSVGSLKVADIPSGAVAVTEYEEISSAPEGLYPMEMELRILLGEREFLNPTRLQNLIRKSTAEGHWMEGTDVETLIVHELAHVLVSRIRMERYGLTDFTYITEENAEAFSACQTDVLSRNQTTAREIVENAYESYRTKQEISLRAARSSISGYALGEQADGGTSYEETIAEAMVDCYLHGEDAEGFSKEILSEIEKNWLFIPFSMPSVAKMKNTQNV